MITNKLDIVIPVFNEGKNIVRLLRALEKEIVCNFRVLICYDSDSDNSLEEIKKAKIINTEILLIKNPRKGPNSAILEGINLTTAKIILIYMADDFENVKIINNMINLIDRGNDVVIPSRFIPGGEMLGATKTKKMTTIIGSYLIYYLARIPFKDCTNAFKMFSSNAKEKINFSSTVGFTFAMELIAKSYFLNLAIIETPSIWIENKYRKSNFKIIKWLPYYIYWLLYAAMKNYILKIKNFF